MEESIGNCRAAAAAASAAAASRGAGVGAAARGRVRQVCVCRVCVCSTLWEGDRRVCGCHHSRAGTSGCKHCSCQQEFGGKNTKNPMQKPYAQVPNGSTTHFWPHVKLVAVLHGSTSFGCWLVVEAHTRLDQVILHSSINQLPPINKKYSNFEVEPMSGDKKEYCNSSRTPPP